MLQYPKELRDMLLRCCEDELLGLPQRFQTPSQRSREKTRQDPRVPQALPQR